jgi:hypothetical protein
MVEKLGLDGDIFARLFQKLFDDAVEDYRFLRIPDILRLASA